MTARTVHIDREPPLRDAVYYRELAESMVVLAAEALRSEGRPMAGARIFDAGCGRGELMAAARRAGALPMGVDIDLACALRGRPHGPVAVADVQHVDALFPLRHFDVVVSSHVLEHVESPRTAVSAMTRLSRRWLILGVPNLLRPANWFLRQARYVNRGHLHGWDVHHFMTFLEAGCGLHVEAWWTDAVTLPPLRRVVNPESRALALLERGLLPRVFPHLMNTLVVLCDVTARPGTGARPDVRAPRRHLASATR